jgi:hypothetical protein
MIRNILFLITGLVLSVPPAGAEVVYVYEHVRHDIYGGPYQRYSLYHHKIQFYRQEDLRYSSAIPYEANYVASRLAPLESHVEGLIEATGKSSAGSLDEELREHDSFITLGKQHIATTEKIVDRAESFIHEIYNRHDRAIDDYVNAHEYYARRVYEDLNDRKQQAASFWATSPETVRHPPQNRAFSFELARTVSGENEYPQDRAMKKALTSFYDCTQSKGGVLGYWKNDGSGKGTFVQVSAVDDPNCLAGLCVCETKL